MRVGSQEVSRRSLLGAGLGAAAGLVLGGCGSGAPASLTLPEHAATGRPRRGGTMRIARPPASRAETLDPASGLSAYEYLGALYNRIVRIGWGGQVAADLAESWESNHDATTWTFRMRPGVTFHDGRPCTARDAAYTLQRILDPKVASPQAGVLTPLLRKQDITAADDRTLVCRLRQPNAEFPSLLTAYQCYVVPEGSGATVARTGIGTGPFRLVDFKAAGRGRVEAYDDHFGGRPVLDAIDFYSIADQQARTNALLAGQVDLLSQTNLDFVTARVVHASDRTTIARVPNGQWYGLPMLTSKKPFDDPTLRQAMKLAYDPQRVIDVAIQGTGAVGHDNPVPPNDPYWTDFRQEHDPGRARRLLARSGHRDFSIDLYTSSYDPVFTPMALAYADSVKEAGIKVRVRTVSADSYYSEIWIHKPFCATYWFTGRPIDQLLNQIFRSGSSYNETAWADKRFDRMLDAARAQTDDAKRKVLYQDAQRYIIEHSGSITPFFGDRLVGISTDVVNYREEGFEFDYLGIGLRRGA